MIETKTYRIKLLAKAIVCFAMGFFIGCIEPYEGEIIDYENILVINANITNELKQQEVRLTRSYRFEEDGPQAETGATVKISTDDGSEIRFEETEPGLYQTQGEYAAIPNVEYQLSVQTADGKAYTSDPVEMPNSTPIEKVYAERYADDSGNDGVGIFVDSYDASASSKYYRFQYQETFKIIAPYWSNYDAVVKSEGQETFSIDVILREREERVCYGEDRDKNVILKSTLGLNEDRLTHFLVRFIEKDNYILTHRYSILVRQYVQNPQAFSYYETLKELSKSSENVFSEDQPGFLAGNVFPAENSGENVAGFFEVSTVDEKRIFFDFEDIFPNEERPPFVSSCDFWAPTFEGTLGTRELLNVIYENGFRFYDFNNLGDPNIGTGPYLMVKAECGDCTVLGSNQIPDFWIE